MRHHEMEKDLAAWVEELGYGEVLSALITTCAYWATVENVRPIEGPCELWDRREWALRRAQRDGERHAPA